MRTIQVRRVITTAYCLAIITTQTTHTMENFFPQHNTEQHTHTPAQACYNTGISEGERAYLQNRLPIAKAALEKMLQQPLTDTQVPKIAFICSGGGYRAMLETVGWLYGAQKIGLLDATTYVTSLSGSTWTVAPWISTGLPLKKFKEYIQDCASKPFFDTSWQEKKLLLEALKVKIENNQSRTLVDPYGGFLANRLLSFLGDARQQVTLSQQAHRIENGTYPYPIYVAIDGRESIVQDQTWYEFTPHTIGDRTNNIHIPTAAYGRKFKNGVSVDNAPEKTLSHLMGTWGSAFAASIDDILENIDNDKDQQDLLEKILEPIGGQRILPFWAEVRNYMYKMDMDEVNDEPLSYQKHLKFVDAGLDFNLPYSPVSGICSERTPEILIFLDASKGKNTGSQLKKTAEYAAKHNRPFPVISMENISKKTMSVFKDENNKTTPIVIYMPGISDTALWEENKLKPEFEKYNLSEFDLYHQTNYGYCATKNFQYAPEHSALVMNQTEFNMRANQDAIIEEIKWCINRK